MTSPTKKANQGPLDEWSTREKLALASAVMKSGTGDTNWGSVSRLVQPFGEKRRPPEWFCAKNCIRQYCSLIEKIQKPKRKRGTETMGESVVKNLRELRIKELSLLIQEGRKKYNEMVQELKDLEAGIHDEHLENYSDESETERDSDEPDLVEEVWTILSDEDSTLSANKDPLANCSVKSSSAEPTPDIQVICLSPVKATSTGPNVSPQLKNLVHTAIAGASEDDRPKTMSPTASAPTLSKLLELPPRGRGQSLPSIPGLMTSTKDTVNLQIESVKLASPPLNASPLIEVEVTQIMAEISEEPEGKNNLKESSNEIVPPTEVIDAMNKDNDTSKSSNVVAEEAVCQDLPTEKDSLTNQVEEDLAKCNHILHDYPLLEKFIINEATKLAEEKDKNEVEIKETLNSNPDMEGDTMKDILKDVEGENIVKSEVETPSSDVKLDNEQFAPNPVAPSELVNNCSTENDTIKDSNCTEPITEALTLNIESAKPVCAEMDIEPPNEGVNCIEVEKKDIIETPVDGKLLADQSTDIEESPKDNAEPDELVVETSIISPKPKVLSEPSNQAILADESDCKKESIKDCTEIDTKTCVGELEAQDDTNLTKTVNEEVTVDLDKPISEAKKEKEPSEAVSPAKVAEIVKTESTDEVQKGVEQDKDSTEKAKNHYIGRGKKQFVVTVIENEKGEKVELKTADGASIKVTRNLSKETGLKIEDLPYSKKSTPALTKDKEDLPVASSSPTKRRRTAAVSESKDTSKVSNSGINTQSHSRQSGSKKTPSKQAPTEIRTPSLRSRGGLSSALTKPEESVLQTESKDTVEPEISKDEKEKPQRDQSQSAKEVSSLPIVKEADKPKLTEEPAANIIKEKSDKPTGEESGDDYSDAISDIESKKDHSDSDADADESDSSRKPNSKTVPKPKKERLESADMADDDSSNSANDALAKKRVTRRSVKTSPRKSESKLRSGDDKPTFRHRDRLSLPAKETSSEVKTGGRPSKAMSRLKHLSEEAHLIYGDLDAQSGDGNGKRITRARAKTGSTPSKSSSPPKNVAQSSEPETSSDAENKTRSTRSRTAAAVQSSSQSVIEQLPPVPIDSNPSSPCSSTTNSTIFDEDKDQRAFRKSIMLVWNRIAAHKYSSLFLKPISEDKAPGYFEKVKRPMDLATIKRNVETGITRTVKTFERDVFLMFMNAMMFNPINHEVSEMASEMERDVRGILEEHHKMLKLSQEGGEGSTPVSSERTLRKDGRSLFTSTPEISALPSCNFSDSDGEMEAIEDEKTKTLASSNQSRKRRAGSNDIVEIPDSKKRKTRTSNSNTNINSSYRKIKPQVSPDIVSASYDNM